MLPPPPVTGAPEGGGGDVVTGTGLGDVYGTGGGVVEVTTVGTGGLGGGVVCMQVHLGVGTFVGGGWQWHCPGDEVSVTVSTVFGVGWLPDKTTADCTWLTVVVAACAAVPDSMIAAAPNARQPDSARMRISISRSFWPDRPSRS
jgi:hypothetical protein